MPQARIAVVHASDFGTPLVDLIDSQRCHAVVVLHAELAPAGSAPLPDKLGGAVTVSYSEGGEPIVYVVPETGVGVVVGPKATALAALMGQPIGMSLAVIDSDSKRVMDSSTRRTTVPMGQILPGRALVITFDHKPADEGKSTVEQVYHDVPSVPPAAAEPAPAPVAPPVAPTSLKGSSKTP